MTVLISIQDTTFFSSSGRRRPSRFAGATAQAGGELSRDLAALGTGGVAFLFLRAYSLGAGTYTGIEAVSNGLPVLRASRGRGTGNAPCSTWLSPWA